MLAVSNDRVPRTRLGDNSESPSQREVDSANSMFFGYGLYGSTRRPIRPLLKRRCESLSPRPGTGGEYLTAPVTSRVTTRKGPAREPEDAMKSLAKKMQRFLVSEDGPTAVEYAVMLALIVVVCLTGIRSIGTKANTTFENTATALG